MRFLYTILFLVVLTGILGVPKDGEAAENNYHDVTQTLTVSYKFKESALNSDTSSESISDSAARPVRYLVASKLRYEILEETTFRREGKEITADQLPVPCKAQITYQELRNGKRNLLKLTVRRLLSGASTKWSEPELQ